MPVQNDINSLGPQVVDSLQPLEKGSQIDVEGAQSTPTPRVSGARSAAPVGSELGAPVDDTQIPGDASLDHEKALIAALVRRGAKRTPDLSLSDEEYEYISWRAIRDFDDAAAGLSEWLENHTRFLSKWRGVVTPKDFPFEGSANITVPLISSFVEIWKARIFKVLFGGGHYARFSSVDGSMKEDELQELNDWFQWELDEVVGVKQAMADVIHDFVLDGIALPYPEYEREVRRLISEREFDFTDGQSVFDQVEAALTTIFQDEQPQIRQTSLGVFDVDFRSRDGDKRNAEVKFLIDNERDKLVACIDKEETVFDGVRLHRINLEDIVVINSASTIEKIPFFGCRVWESVVDFMRKVKSGEYRDFDKETLENIKAGAKVREAEVVPMDRTTLADEEEGTQSTDPSGVDMARRWLELYRWEGWWSPDEIEHPGDPTSGRNAPIGIVAIIDVQSREVLKVERLERINKDGKRSPVKFDFIRQPDRFFSIGCAEWLQHLQEEQDGIHNQRLDAGLLANCPWYLFEPTAGAAFSMQTISPGKGLPVKDVSKILFPQLQLKSAWSFQEEANVRRLAQEQAGLGDSSMGTYTSKRTSASEFVGTQQSTDLRTEFIAESIIGSFRELLYRVFGLYQQYARDGRVFQVTGIKGEKIVKSLAKDRLHGKVMLHLSANVQQLSEELERSTAINMLSLLLNPVLVQLGVVKSQSIYAALKKLFSAMGYKGVPIYEPDVAPESDTPDLEHKRMMQGEAVQPSPTENFQQHLAAHMQLASNPNLPQYMPPEAIALLQQHIQQTQLMEQQVQQMRAVQAAMAQQMSQGMERMGVRPGLPGGQQTGDNAAPASAEEGAVGAPAENA